MRRAMEQDDTKATAEREREEDDIPTLLVELPPRREAEMRRCFSQSDCQVSAATSGGSQMLTEAHIFDNLLQTNVRASSEEPRPRQYGRRLEGPPTPVRSLIMAQSRPQSAPTRVQMREPQLQETPTHPIMSTCSELSSARSSRMPSPVSLPSDSSSSGSSSAEQEPDK